MTEEKGLSLYKIADSLKAIEEMAEDDPGLLEYLDAVQMQLQEKVGNIIHFTRSLDLTEQAIGSEIDRLTKMKKSTQKKREWLEEYISRSMQNHDIERIDTDIARVSFRKSKSVLVDDPTKLPKEFIVTKTTESPDKLAIKAALEAGEEVAGARLIESKNLQIK